MTQQQKEQVGQEPGAGARHLALAELGDEAVLLDLRSGGFYKLNRVAMQICKGLIEWRTDAEIAASLAAAFGVPAEQCARDVENLLRQIDAQRQPSCMNPITFTAEADGYRMSWNGAPACRLEPRRQRLSLCSEGIERFRPHLDMVLLWAAPHLLTLSGVTVLHGSAVAWGGEVIAFCGSSGQGKTTLARQLAGQGVPLVSEDLVLVRWNEAGPSIVRGGEVAVRAWVASQVPILAGQGWVATDGLRNAVSGPCSPLSQVNFLAQRTPGQAIERVALSPADALVRLLENGFAELGVADVWLSLLRASERLVQEVGMWELRCPDGVAVLREALAGYNWMTKS